MKVIVTGGDHHNTYGVIRALGQKRITPFLLLVSEKNESFMLCSKYISGSEIVKNEREAILYLKKNNKDNEGSIVIACSDGMSSALDSNRDSLVPYYKLPGSAEQGRITSIMDKEVMSQWGRRFGFNVPKSWVVETTEDIADVEYPCITKPILSKDGKKTDISICNNSDELESLIRKGSCYRYQVQKFVEKDFEYQLIGLSLNEGKNVIIPGFSKCIRPCPRTNTGFLHYESIDSIMAPIEKCKSFILETGYSGLFSIEFLRDKNGIDYFMEMNFRNDGNAICVTASGINLPYLWCLANSKVNYQEEIRASTFKPVYVMPEFADFTCFVRTHKISIIRWIKDIMKTDSFMVFNTHDIRPFLFILNKKLKQLICK